MANKKITDVDVVSTVSDADYLFVNQGQSIKQIKKSDIPKPIYTAEEVGALPNTTTALPNPNALTFTGAATGSYDGSSPIEINIPEGGGTDVTVDTTLSVAGQAADAKATGDAISQLSEEKIDNPSTGSVGQILEIESVDEKGKPKTYKAVDKPTSSGEVSDEQISSAVSEYMANNPIEESDPTVPEWAKSPQKPTYTASEVGADAAGTAESKVSAHNVSDTAHNDIRLLVQGLTERLNALADSDDTTLDQMSEIVSYIKYNRSLINGIDTNKVDVSDIINNLTSNNTDKPLSAKQGRVLKSLIDAIIVPTKLSELENDSGYAKTTDIPDKLPNPQKLTFAGAITAEYDGSGAVTVTIPESSGGSGVSDEKIAEAVGTYMETHPIEETDPTVPEWAKQPTKPKYTASEVGAIPDTTKIPSKTSDLQNDRGFLTEHQVNNLIDAKLTGVETLLGGGF